MVHIHTPIFVKLMSPHRLDKFIIVHKNVLCKCIFEI
nr:MAG TPA: hypothetical protein [Caudoviricetes sp.]